MKDKLYLYTINKHYGSYLNKYDTNTMDISGKKSNRPFVGTIVMVNNKKYLAPLTSPKPKHIHMKSNTDFIKIDNGKLGAINLNNMVPVDNGLYKKIDINNEPDQKYKTIMINQYRWMEKNKEIIINKAKNLHSKYIENKLPDNIKNRCANYPKLEKLLDRYMIERQSKVNAKENTR